MKNFIQHKCKSIVFDMDNTLFDEAEFYKKIFHKLYLAKKIELRPNEALDSFKKLRSTSKDIFYDILSGDKTLSDKDILFLRDELFEMACNLRYEINPYEDALLFLKYVTNLNIDLYILTNGVSKIQKNKFNSLNLNSYFGDNFYSARELGQGIEKPDSIVFKKIIEITGNKIEEIIFIGDNPKTDFKFPHEIGCKTIRLRRGLYKNIRYNGHVDYEISSYKELM